MKQRKRTIVCRLMLWLMILLLLPGATGNIALAAELPNEETSPLTPPPIEYENGNVILQKQAERIGPDDWKVTVKVTVGEKPVEKRKMEVVLLLDISSSMRTNTAHDHTETCDDLVCTKHIHDDSCYRAACGIPEHEHTDDCCSRDEHEHVRNHRTGCYTEKCTQHSTNSQHRNAGCYQVRYGSQSQRGWYMLSCGKEEHEHSADCDSLCEDNLVEHSHQDSCYELGCGLSEANHTHSLGCYHCPYYASKVRSDRDDEYLHNSDATRLAVAAVAAERLIASLPEETRVVRLAFATNFHDGISHYYNIGTESGTYMWTAISKSLNGDYFTDEESKKIFVVLTDGQANDGSSSYTAATSALNAFKNPDGTDGAVFTVGFGNYDDYADDLEEIAGNGGYRMLAENASELSAAFEELGQTLTAMLEDPMGANVGFTVGSIEEIQNTSGDITVSGDNETIYWHPKSDGTDTVSNSVIEYSYTVSLNDSADRDVGEHKNVPLNKPTYFMYGIVNDDGTANMKSAAFPIPKADYAYSSVQTVWQTTNGQSIGIENLQQLRPDLQQNPTEVETVISDYSSATYIPAFTQDYDYAPPVIPIVGRNEYYRYVGTTVTADGVQLGGVADVDATQPVAYRVVHQYELVQPNEVYISGTKYMGGRDFAEGDSFSFTFSITAETPNAPMPEGAVNGTVNATINPTSGNAMTFGFDKIVFREAGVYAYTVQEQEGNQDKVIYDTTPRRMVVTVVDNGGKLTATYSIDGVENAPLYFVNRLETGTLKVEKAAVVSHLDEHQDKVFDFLIQAKNMSGRPITSSYQLTYSDGTTGSVTFTNGYASVSLKAGQSVIVGGLPDGAVYTVTEDAAGGFTPTATGAQGTIAAHEQRVASFTNTYAASTRYQFFGTKVLQNANLTRGQFRFAIEDAEGNVVARGTNTPDGSIFFDTMTFTHEDVGQKTYYIYEVPGDDENILYDTQRYAVTLNITDKGDGSLSITDDLNGRKITFVNKYVTNQLSIFKNVDGNMGNKNKVFSFTLAVPDQAGQVINISVDRGLTFREITLDDQGKTEFTMMHGDNVIFYPITGAYTVTEDDNENYVVSYSLNNETAVVGTSVTGTIPDQGSHSIRFVNTLSVSVPTGISTSVSAALAGIVIAVALLAAVCAGRRWRSREE